MSQEKVRVTFNLQRKKKERLQEIAERQGVTMSALIVWGINDTLSHFDDELIGYRDYEH
jgi:hypothetical protein